MNNITKTDSQNKCSICKINDVNRNYAGYCKECNSLVTNIRYKQKKDIAVLSKLLDSHVREIDIINSIITNTNDPAASIAKGYIQTSKG